MVRFKAFSGLKNIFSRLNPIPSFKWDEPEEEIIIPPSSDELLERVIKKYPKLKYAILISFYHLVNTRGETNEFLSVLTKDLRLVSDLVEGNNLIVNTPHQVEIEGKKKNILIASHNHFFGAIIPSLGDLCKALESNCNLISIVSENRIGMVVIEYDSVCDKDFVDEFINFHGYLDICFAFERSNELSQLKSLQISNVKLPRLVEAVDFIEFTVKSASLID